MKRAKTAATQLSECLGSENVYCVFQHAMSSDNLGNNEAPIRAGIFDVAFAINRNRPIGFALKGSPFGEEPFDGTYEQKWNIQTGTFSDNFDGYLFLHPLHNEPQSQPLSEIFSNDFIEEMKRRALYLDNNDMEWLWFGRKASDLTREYIIERLSKQ